MEPMGKGSEGFLGSIPSCPPTPPERRWQGSSCHLQGVLKGCVTCWLQNSYGFNLGLCVWGDLFRVL